MARVLMPRSIGWTLSDRLWWGGLLLFSIKRSGTPISIGRPRRTQHGDHRDQAIRTSREKFTPAVIDNETKPEWYLRQILGTANFDAGPILAFLSGNLCYQIEHHLFPDLPSNRYSEIAVRVRALCAKYDLPYTTGPLTRQYLLTLRTIHKLALPDRFLTATSDDAPETASEQRFGPPTIAGLNQTVARGADCAQR